MSLSVSEDTVATALAVVDTFPHYSCLSLSEDVDEDNQELLSVRVDDDVIARENLLHVIGDCSWEYIKAKDKYHIYTSGKAGAHNSFQLFSLVRRRLTRIGYEVDCVQPSPFNTLYFRKKII